MSDEETKELINHGQINRPLLVGNKRFAQFFMIPNAVVGILGFSFYAFLVCLTLGWGAFGWIFGVLFFFDEALARAFDALTSTMDPEDKEKYKRIFSKTWFIWAFQAVRAIFLIGTVVTFAMRYISVITAVSAAIPMGFAAPFGIFMSLLVTISLVCYTSELYDTATDDQVDINHVLPAWLQDLTKIFMRPVNAFIVWWFTKFSTLTKDQIHLDEQAADYRHPIFVKMKSKFFYTVQATHYLFIGAFSFTILFLAMGLSWPLSILLAMIAGSSFASSSYISSKWNIKYKASHVNDLILKPKLKTAKTERTFYLATFFNCIATVSLGVTLYVGFHVFIPFIVAAGLSASIFTGFGIFFAIGFALLAFGVVQQVIERKHLADQVEAYLEKNESVDAKTIKNISELRFLPEQDVTWAENPADEIKARVGKIHSWYQDFTQFTLADDASEADKTIYAACEHLFCQAIEQMGEHVRYGQVIINLSEKLKNSESEQKSNDNNLAALEKLANTLLDQVGKYLYKSVTVTYNGSHNSSDDHEEEQQANKPAVRHNPTDELKAALSTIKSTMQDSANEKADSKEKTAFTARRLADGFTYDDLIKEFEAGNINQTITEEAKIQTRWQKIHQIKENLGSSEHATNGCKPFFSSSVYYMNKQKFEELRDNKDNQAPEHVTYYRRISLYPNTAGAT